MRTAPSANLDFLRAFAVLLVLSQHLCRRAHLQHIGWIAVTSLGLFGVLLFFVHTSLVLMQSLERQGARGWPLFRNFYIRRFFRIYPLSILAVLAALAFRLDSDINGVAGLSRGVLPGKLTIVSHILLVQNLVNVKSIVNVLWSLPYEVQMYVLLPFLFTWICSRRNLLLVFAVWLGGLAAALIQPHVPLFNRLSILVFFPNFLAGLIAFRLSSRGRINWFLWPIFLVGLATIFTLKPVRVTGWVLCLALGVTLPYFREIGLPWLRTASKHIATYSYGIYLSHQFSIWIAFGVLQSESFWIKIPLFVGLLFLLPVMLYHSVEKPMINLGHRLADSWDRDVKVGTRAAAAAA